MAYLVGAGSERNEEGAVQSFTAGRIESEKIEGLDLGLGEEGNPAESTIARGLGGSFASLQSFSALGLLHM